MSRIAYGCLKFSAKVLQSWFKVKNRIPSHWLIVNHFGKLRHCIYKNVFTFPVTRNIYQICTYLQVILWYYHALYLPFQVDPWEGDLWGQEPFTPHFLGALKEGKTVVVTNVPHFCRFPPRRRRRRHIVSMGKHILFALGTMGAAIVTKLVLKPHAEACCFGLFYSIVAKTLLW